MTSAGPRGVFAPVATLFDSDGALDLQKFKKNMNWYATSDLDGIVIMGSNGEFALLDQDEKLNLIEAGVEAINGRKTVMAGVGVESTRGTIEMAKRAADLGVDYCLVVTPHYYSPKYDDRAVLRHYQTVAEASPVPVIVYIMTAYTGVDLASGLVAELSQHPNIVGVKDSGGNAPKFVDMVSKSTDGFSVLAGSASFLYPALCVGAAGGVLALANVAPRECAQLMSLFGAGKHEEAMKLQQRLFDPNAAVTSRYGIAGLKVAMELVGLETSDPRAPLLPATDDERAAVQRIMEQAGILAAV